MTESDRRKKLFYAEALAGLYDRTIDLVVPQYRLLHEAMVRLLRNHFTARRSGARIGTKYILDIGSGTGAESLRVVEEFPGTHIVALDLCEPMHAELRRNFVARFGDRADFSASFTTITADIVAPEAVSQKLFAALPEAVRSHGFDAVISAFALHHLSHAEKHIAYTRAFECLAPHGCFINGDLFSHASAELTRQAHEFDLEWIDSHFRSPTSLAPDAASLPAQRLEDLRRRWIEHYLSENVVEPLDSAAGIEGQANMLGSVGFSEVGCPFRYWQVAILWAIK